MRHITAHISIWNKLGWIGIICYFVFAAAAPEVLSEGNTWVGLSMALLCVVLISLPWKKLFNVLALVGMMAWLVVTRAIPGFTFLQHNPIWLLIGLACVIVSCWDPDPEDVETEVELDPDLARSPSSRTASGETRNIRSFTPARYNPSRFSTRDNATYPMPGAKVRRRSMTARSSVIPCDLWIVMAHAQRNGT